MKFELRSKYYFFFSINFPKLTFPNFYNPKIKNTPHIPNNFLENFFADLYSIGYTGPLVLVKNGVITKFSLLITAVKQLLTPVLLQKNVKKV